MILNNYWKGMKIVESAAAQQNTSLDFHLVGISGNEIGAILTSWRSSTSLSDPAVQNSNLRTARTEIRIGKGTGTPTANDYGLFDDCTSDISDLTFNNSTQYQDGAFSQILVINGANNTSNPITITEVGVCKTFLTAAQSYSEPVMLAKTILDNPITVQGGNTFRVIIEWLEQ